MFSGGIPEGYSAEELARLQEIDKMVSADSKVDLKAAVESYQNQLDNNGGTIQQIQKSVIGDNGQAQNVSFTVRDVSGEFTKEFYEDTTFTGNDAKDIAMAELQQRVLNAAQTNDAISSAMNSLLVGAMELNISDDVNNPNDQEIKESAGSLLSLASTLESVASSIPTKDSEGNDIEANVEFYDKAQAMQDQLQADYVGMSLEDWQAIGQKSTAEQERADRINAVTVGVSYEEWVNFGSDFVDDSGNIIPANQRSTTTVDGIRN